MASFEQNLQKLEDIVSKMEGGELPLDAALAQFEQGIKLARQCQKTLEVAEQKVQILLNTSEDGKTDTLAPFDADAPPENVTSPAKTAAKKAPKSKAAELDFGDEDEFPF